MISLFFLPDGFARAFLDGFRSSYPVFSTIDNDINREILMMTLLLLIVAVCFLSFANGANDNFKGVASLYGSGAATYRMALF